MKIYIMVDDNNHVINLSNTHNSDNEIMLEVEEWHEVLSNPFVFKYVDGELIKDENKRQQLINEMNKPSDKERIEALEKALLDLILGGGTID